MVRDILKYRNLSSVIIVERRSGDGDGRFEQSAAIAWDPGMVGRVAPGLFTPQRTPGAANRRNRCSGSH